MGREVIINAFSVSVKKTFILLVFEEFQRRVLYLRNFHPPTLLPQIFLDPHCLSTFCSLVYYCYTCTGTNRHMCA